MRITWLPVIILLCVAGSSCEKSIHFVPDNASPSVVVEASIENGQAPVVILSSSVDYFSQITPQILQQSFIHQALVKISNGSRTMTLKEYEVPAGNGYNVYYYSTDSSQPANIFAGELNTQYSLQVEAGGKTYSAVTSIPPLAKKIDSLWWRPAPPGADSNQVVLMSRITDPPGLGNYIRYFTKTNGGPFLPGLNSVFDDQIVDGTTYDIQVDQGVNRNETIDFANYAFFHRGDTVTVKFCNIDKATYDFWRTMEYSYSSIGNPFSTPTKVLGNVPGALGYFGGYAAQYISLVIPQ